MSEKWIVKDKKVLEIQGPGPVSLQDGVEGNPEALFRLTPNSVSLNDGWEIHGTEFLGPGKEVLFLMEGGNPVLAPVTVVHSLRDEPGFRSRFEPRTDGVYYMAPCDGSGGPARRLERFDPRFLHRVAWPGEVLTVAFVDNDGHCVISVGPAGCAGFVLRW